MPRDHRTFTQGISNLGPISILELITVNLELQKIRVYSTGNSASIEIKVPKGASVKAFDFGFGALPGDITFSGEGTCDCAKGTTWSGNQFSTLTCAGKKIN